MFASVDGSVRSLLAGLAVLSAVVAAGCGGTNIGPLYPVTGRVLLDGKPLEGKVGSVALRPDTSKGNKASWASAGELKGDGTFSIQTNGTAGATPGWYKVVIIAHEPESNPNEDVIRALDERYEKEATTPLVIEVVASPGPGSYDLPVTP